MRSKRPNAPPKLSRPATISSSDAPSASASDAAAARCRRCRARAARSRTRRVALRRRQQERDGLEPVQLELTRRDVERRPCVPARGAAVVAEVADVGGRVLVRRPAADAPLRVRGVLEARPRVPAGRRARRPARPARSRARSPTCGSSPFTTSVEAGAGRGHRPPARGHVLELAVAVELVAEQVAEADGARAHAPRDLRQRRLVDLEQAELGPVGREQGGGDARDEVRARVVVRQLARAGRGSPRPSTQSSSCRSSRRRARCRARAARTAARARPGRAA